MSERGNKKGKLYIMPFLLISIALSVEYEGYFIKLSAAGSSEKASCDPHLVSMA